MEPTNPSPDPTPPPGEPDAPHSLEELIERWWQDHFPGSPVAQVTQAWNHAFAAKDELKRRLAQLFVNFPGGVL